jgi:hypothetical protein
MAALTLYIILDLPHISHGPVSADRYHSLYLTILLLMIAEAACLFAIWKWSRLAVYAWYLLYAAQAVSVVLLVSARDHNAVLSLCLAFMSSLWLYCWWLAFERKRHLFR